MTRQQNLERLRNARSVTRKRQAALCARRAVERRATVGRAKRHARFSQPAPDNALLDAERLATLTTVAAGVGHELNNMALILAGNCEMIREQAARGEVPDADSLRHLERASQHITTHARQLLSLDSPKDRGIETVDLRSIASDVRDMLATSGRTKRATVELVPASHAVPVSMNPVHAEQVILNLVINAADALDSVEDRECRIRVTIDLDPSDEHAILRVADTGPGVPREQFDRIFEPHYTTKPPGKGTGLGLPVVRQIAERYGGTVAIESRVGVGTTVAVHLPVAGAE